MEPIRIDVFKDFSRTPGPRYIKEGEFSGELFRTEILFPAFKRAFKENRKVLVNLDGTAGYGTSFLEEVFGGLIREDKLHFDPIVQHLELISNEEEYLKADIIHYLTDAEEKSK